MVARFRSLRWYILCVVLRRLLHISRPVLWINTVGSGFVGMWLAGHLWSWGFVPVLLWLTLPFNLLIYGVNDIFDRETDAANPRKGSLEGARIQPGEIRAIWASVLFSNATFAAYFALALPPAATLWMAAYAGTLVLASPAIVLAWCLPSRAGDAARGGAGGRGGGCAQQAVLHPLGKGAGAAALRAGQE